MTDSYISGSEVDKKLQTYENTVSGEVVHSEAVTPTDSSGAPFSASNRMPVDIGAAKDIFGNSVVVSRFNHMEVPLDAADYADFISEDSQHGGTVQANGETRFTTGAHLDGYCNVSCLDATRYRSGQEAGVGFTCYFPSGAVAGVRQRIGAVLGSWDDAVWIGYDDTGANFGVYYYRAGVEQQFTSLAAINTLLGYTLDPAKDQICRIVFGLFGHRGWVFEVCKPSGDWATIASYTGINSDAGPAFPTEFDITVRAHVDNQGNNATNVAIASSCWAGWTTSGHKRLSDPFSDRTLVLPTQSVIVGKTTAGGSGYVAVKVNPSGTLAVGNTSVGAVASAVPTDATLLGGEDSSGNLADLQVRTSDPATDDAGLVVRQAPRARTVSTYDRSSAATTDLITPAAGNAIRMSWFSVQSAPTNSAAVDVTLTLGSNSIKARLSQYGSAFSHRIDGFYEGAADDALSVTLSAAQAVTINIESEEVTP